MSNTTAPELSATQIESIEAEAKSLGVFDNYKAMISDGVSPRLAIMLAARRCPGIKGTDTQFQKLENERVNHDYTDGDMATIHQIAKNAGISTAGKTYNGTLGKYTDPLAWVSDTGDVRRAAKEKGLSLRGQVNVENEAKPLNKRKLSKRLVRETEKVYLASSPKLAEKCRKKPSARHELREMIVEKHGAKRSS